MYKLEELKYILSKQPEYPVIGASIATTTIFAPLVGILQISEVHDKLAKMPYLANHLGENYLGYFYLGFLFFMFIVFLIRNYRAKIKKCDLIGFKYDQDGVLWHGNECNIAFRDITFLKLLRDITADFDEKYRNKLFLEAGRDMGKGFGKHFKSQIYPKELKKNDISFNQLPKAERLRLWSEYDSSTGWGLISVIDMGKTLYITSKHRSLFDEETGGKCFSYTMAGYAESVVNKIMSDLGVEYTLSDDDVDTSDNEIILFHLIPIHH